MQKETIHLRSDAVWVIIDAHCDDMCVIRLFFSGGYWRRTRNHILKQCQRCMPSLWPAKRAAVTSKNVPSLLRKFISAVLDMCIHLKYSAGINTAHAFILIDAF